MQQLQVYYKSRLYQYYLVHYPGETYKQWEVVGSNSSLLLTCDRPKALREHVPGYRWHWVVDGKHLSDTTFQRVIIEVLERQLRRQMEEPFMPERKVLR